MNAIRIAAFSLAVVCAGCKTVIIRPSAAPKCVVPIELKKGCVATATLARQVTYGDLPDIVLQSRQDFVECRKTYLALLQSYEFCTDQLHQFNEKLKKLEDDIKGKHNNVEAIEN